MYKNLKSNLSEDFINMLRKQYMEGKSIENLAVLHNISVNMVKTIIRGDFMGYIKSEDKNGNITSINNRVITSNGRKYTIPKYIKCKSMSVVNGDIYIDGYYFDKEEGTWKKTFLGFWYKYFG